MGSVDRNADVCEVTVTAPVNIAVIKYWGKRCSEKMLPTNSSLSLTLSQDVLHSRTTIRASIAYTSDKLWLNGKEESISSPRTQCVLNTLREYRRRLEEKNNQEKLISTYYLHIASVNNFPTAAGLASSASGFSALVFALAKLYELPMDAYELSKLARLGSGSACRSMMGGYVMWDMGRREDGEDSGAVQIASELDWPDIEALVLVVNDARKETPSTLGMQNTLNTSLLFPTRVASIVPQRIETITHAIHNRDFPTFAELTMRDSNQFHAVCLDSWPPVSYMNDISRAIVAWVHEINGMASSTSTEKYIAAYTFDAGPNAVIYAPRKHIHNLISLAQLYFPSSTFNLSDPKIANSQDAYFFNDHYQVLSSYPHDVDYITRFQSFVSTSVNKDKSPRPRVHPLSPGSVKRILHARVGDGPRLLEQRKQVNDESEYSLLDNEGLPK